MQKKAMTLLPILLLLTGCGEEEKLQQENASLKARVAELEKEIAVLKETADYHFQRGVEAMQAGNPAKAVKKFEKVISKFPESPLISTAREKLAEAERAAARQEKEASRQRLVAKGKAAGQAACARLSTREKREMVNSANDMGGSAMENIRGMIAAYFAFNALNAHPELRLMNDEETQIFQDAYIDGFVESMQLKKVERDW